MAMTIMQKDDSTKEKFSHFQRTHQIRKYEKLKINGNYDFLLLNLTR